MPVTIKSATYGANTLSREQQAEDLRDLLNRAYWKRAINVYNFYSPPLTPTSEPRFDLLVTDLYIAPYLPIPL